MAAAEAGSTVAPHGVDLVDKDDAGRIFFALNEQIPDTRGADADEHLDKVRTADAEKRHSRFAGNGSSQQGFAGPWGAHQQASFGNSAAKFREFFRIF